MTVYLSGIYQGIIWGMMGLGLFISFRILRFADLTSEASFAVGAAVAVRLITLGVNPVLATLGAILGGVVTGAVTGVLATYFEIPGLLASIITMTAFYSVNLRVMERSNLSLRGFETIYDLVPSLTEYPQEDKFVIGILFVLIVILLLVFLFKTDLGQAIIATGDNEVMAGSLGIHTPRMKRLGLMLANGIIALCGALIGQDNGFSDVNMGAGTVVVAMASIVIGEVFFFKQIKLGTRFLSIVVGSIIYRLILVFVLRQGFNANDFKLLSALVLAVFLAVPKLSRVLSGLRRPSIDAEL